jgi:hypothetical protein
MHVSGTVVLLLVVLVILLLFVSGSCSLTCGEKSEKFTIGPLGNNCDGLNRTPNDFVMKQPDGWKQNPHWKVDPGSTHQELSEGPIDLYHDLRRLADGRMYEEFSSDYAGCPNGQIKAFDNDEKNRYDVVQAGDTDLRRQLGSRFEQGLLNRGKIEFPDLPSIEAPFQRLYGGNEYLKNAHLL